VHPAGCPAGWPGTGLAGGRAVRPGSSWLRSALRAPGDGGRGRFGWCRGASEPPFAGPEPSGYCLTGDAVGSFCCLQSLAADPEQVAPGERRGGGGLGGLWHGTKLAKE